MSQITNGEELAQGRGRWFFLQISWRRQPGPNEKAQVNVQVKSRYATVCDRGFPVKEKSLDALTT